MSKRKNIVPLGILPASLDWAGVNALAAKYSLNVPVIDEQHAILFGWYVALKTAPQVHPVLAGLRAYAEGHFRDEEQWAAMRGVDMEAHQLQHDDLLGQLDEALGQPQPSRLATQSLVFDWLTAHIDVEDRAMVMEANRN